MDLDKESNTGQALPALQQKHSVPLPGSARGKMARALLWDAKADGFTRRIPGAHEDAPQNSAN
jgi:hypothetical protein